MNKLFYIFISVLFLSSSLSAEDKKVDDRYPFRTTWANEHLEWYKSKALEFPPHHSDVRLSGEFVSLDFVHRTGTFRLTNSGELVKFSMPAYASVSYLNTETHLRNVPLGVHFLLFLIQDEDGKFTRLVTAQDQFTMDKSHAYTYKVKEVYEDKLIAIKQSIKKGKLNIAEKTFLLTDRTKFTKEDKQVTKAELSAGDEILVNLTGRKNGFGGYCSDVFIGLKTHDLVESQQEDAFYKFQKFRGLPGWVTKTEGEHIEVSLFSGDAKSFKKTWMSDFKLNETVLVCVANDELRTWNPPVDKIHSKLVAIDKLPTNAYGTSGVKLTIKVSAMLEGFRKGRVVRVFGKGWRPKNTFYGESLMNYGYRQKAPKSYIENAAKEYPSQFPFRTDYSNRHLAWFKLKLGVFPPPFAEHKLKGNLLSVDAEKLEGQFQLESTGEIRTFSLFRNKHDKIHHDLKILKEGEKSKLQDLKIGQEYRFHTFQDESGSFSIVTQIQDEFSYLKNERSYFKIKELSTDQSKILVTVNLPYVRNYNKDMEPVPELAIKSLHVNEETKIWFNGKPGTLGQLKLGDLIRVNYSSELPDKQKFCVEIFVEQSSLDKLSKK